MDVDLCTADYFYCVKFDILLFFFLYRLMKKQKLLTCFPKSKSSNAQHEDSNNSTSYERLDDSKTADDEEQPPLEFSTENASNERLSVPPTANIPFNLAATFEFPKSKCGKQNRSCQSSWFDSYTWLHYRIEDDSVLCNIYAKHELKGNLESVIKKERAFLDQGFRNLRKAIDYFRTHQQSECHKTATDLEIAPQTCKNIIELTNENVKKPRSAERSYFIKVMETVQFLGRQGIAFQGESENDNFTQALLFRGKDDTNISKRLNAPITRQLKRYTDHDYQYELLKIMSKHVLSTKLSQIQHSPFFAPIADEYTDISNKEQVSICVRWIDPESLSAYEDFLGFYEV